MAAPGLNSPTPEAKEIWPRAFRDSHPRRPRAGLEFGLGLFPRGGWRPPAKRHGCVRRPSAHRRRNWNPRTRANVLTQRGTMPDQQYDDTRSRHERAVVAVIRSEAMVSRLEVELRYATVRAPMDGIVLEIPIGKRVQNVTYFEVEVDVFDAGAEKLLPRMAADADIVTETAANVLWVPETALHYEGDEIYLELVAPDAEERLVVKLGIIEGDRVELVSGASEGDLVRLR